MVVVRAQLALKWQWWVPLPVPVGPYDGIVPRLPQWHKDEMAVSDVQCLDISRVLPWRFGQKKRAAPDPSWRRDA